MKSSNNQKNKYSLLIYKCVFFLLMCLFSLSCNNKTDAIEHFVSLDENLYYDEDPYTYSESFIYGKWKFISMETWGVVLIGTTYTVGVVENYPPEFDYLLIKQNGIFGIQDKNKLLTIGKVSDDYAVDDLFQIKFIPEEENLDFAIIDTTLFSPEFSSDSDTLKLKYDFDKSMIFVRE